jgi:hypothetical protein
MASRAQLAMKRESDDLMKRSQWAFRMMIFGVLAACFTALIVANYYVKGGGLPWPR